MPRQARLDSPGTLHHVIVRGIEGKDIVEGEYEEGVALEALKGGSLREPLPRLRAQLFKELLEKYGLDMTETDRQLGVSTSAISRIPERNKGVKN